MKQFDICYCDPLQLFRQLSNLWEIATINMDHVTENELCCTDALRSLQTRAAVRFFLLIHIPLARVHVSLSILTAFFVTWLNLRTKYWLYLRINKAICSIAKKLGIFHDEMENNAQIKSDLEFKNNRYRDLTDSLEEDNFKHKLSWY